MPSRPARNRLLLTLAAMISAAAPVIASRPGHEASVLLRPAGHARPEPPPTAPCSDGPYSSVASFAPCPPPSEVLLARRHTTWLGEWAVTGLIPAHGSQQHPRQGQAPDALLSLQHTGPLLPGPPLRILFCSWVV